MPPSHANDFLLKGHRRQGPEWIRYCMCWGSVYISKLSGYDNLQDETNILFLFLRFSIWSKRRQNNLYAQSVAYQNVRRKNGEKQKRMAFF